MKFHLLFFLFVFGCSEGSKPLLQRKTKEAFRLAYDSYDEQAMENCINNIRNTGNELKECSPVLWKGKFSDYNDVDEYREFSEKNSPVLFCTRELGCPGQDSRGYASGGRAWSCYIYPYKRFNLYTNNMTHSFFGTTISLNELKTYCAYTY